MNFKKIQGLLFITTIIVLFSCNYKSARMLETPKGYEFDQPPLNDSSEFIISIGDIISFTLYTNDGTTLIDLTAISIDQIAPSVKDMDMRSTNQRIFF